MRRKKTSLCQADTAAAGGAPHVGTNRAAMAATGAYKSDNRQRLGPSHADPTFVWDSKPTPGGGARIPTNTRHKTPTPHPPHDNHRCNHIDRNAYKHRNVGGLTMRTMLENDRRLAPGKNSASRGTPLWSS